MYNYVQKGPSFISYHDLEDYLTKLKNEGQSPETRNTKRACLNSHFGFLHGLGLIMLNPAFPLKKAKGTKQNHGEKETDLRRK